MEEIKVRLRPITEADLPDYVRWLNDPEVTQFLSIESGGFTLEYEREWLAGIQSPECKVRPFGIEADGRHIGNCSIGPARHEQVGGIGLVIGDKCAWGKGFGTAALTELLRIGFEELGYLRIQLNVHSQNARAKRCYEKSGFRYEGTQRKSFLKRGEWIDVITMAILREEWEEMTAVLPDGLCQIGPEHVDEVLTLWSKTDLWPHACEDREMIAAALAKNRECAVGWRIAGELVGTTIGTLDGFRGFLYRIAVHPDHQRKGIATALIAEAERRLFAAGIKQINLGVQIPNKSAHALYEKLGYEYSEVHVMRKRRNP